jgi:hypothetical protein
MNQELEASREAYAWGKSPFSHTIAKGLDEIVKINDFSARQDQADYWTHALYSHLSHEIPIKVLEHLKFDVVHPKMAETDPEDPTLREIKHKLMDEFGHEVVRRVNITLSETPVQHHFHLPKTTT